MRLLAHKGNKQESPSLQSSSITCECGMFCCSVESPGGDVRGSAGWPKSFQAAEGLEPPPYCVVFLSGHGAGYFPQSIRDDLNTRREGAVHPKAEVETSLRCESLRQSLGHDGRHGSRDGCLRDWLRKRTSSGHPEVDSQHGVWGAGTTPNTLPRKALLRASEEASTWTVVM